MRNCTTVWRVTAYEEIIRHYHFATKREAQAFVREHRAEVRDIEPLWGEPDIDPVRVELNATGIARVLDDFITRICANE